MLVNWTKLVTFRVPVGSRKSACSICVVAASSDTKADMTVMDGVN